MLYTFRCDSCDTEFDEFSKWEDIGKVKCSCGKKVRRVFTSPCLITDTSFPYTGEYDKRLGCKIEGRKHWNQKLAEKGYVELSGSQVKNMD
jgi:putative FmdB family regulatory protein